MKRTRQKRGFKGASLAELPASLYLIFIGLLVPLLALAVFSYRVSMVYFAMRNACKEASIATTYTTAKAKAASTWATDCAGWSGITGTEQLFLVIRTLPAGTETQQSTPLPANPGPNTANNLYFYRIACVATVQPWFGGPWMKMNIPGLTQPLRIPMNYEYIVENTPGLVL